MSDAGMPMPETSVLMPMPRYGHKFTYFKDKEKIAIYRAGGSFICQG
jgi:hypothetical protein